METAQLNSAEILQMITNGIFLTLNEFIDASLLLSLFRLVLS
jgi:hypothetical protein